MLIWARLKPEVGLFHSYDVAGLSVGEIAAFLLAL